MKKLVCGALAAALLGSLAAPAFAADPPSTKSAPVYAPVDESFDPFLVRFRGLAVLPDASGTTLFGKTLPGAALSDQGIPELDVTYFFTRHWAVEAIAGFAYAHRLTASPGAVLGNAANQGIANTTLLPPTVSLQYHFALGQWDPYVGVGANYTWFLWTKSALGAQYGNANIINIHSNAGVAFQAGFDYYLTKHWVLNVDAKYLLLSTTADVNVAGVNGLNQAHVNVNPWIVGAGIGYRFGVADLVPAPVVAKY